MAPIFSSQPLPYSHVSKVIVVQHVDRRIILVQWSPANWKWQENYFGTSSQYIETVWRLILVQRSPAYWKWQENYFGAIPNEDTMFPSPEKWECPKQDGLIQKYLISLDSSIPPHKELKGEHFSSEADQRDIQLRS